MVCQRQAKHLVEVQNKFAARGVRVVGVTKEDRARAERFVADYQLNYAVIPDGAELFRRFGVRTAPATKLIAPDGTVVADERRAGWMSRRSGAIEQTLERELAAAE